MFHIIGIEAEIAYSFARDLPPEDAPYSREAVLDAIASMHPAIEVVDTRFQTFGKVNPLVQTLRGSAALPIADWQCSSLG